MSDARQHNTEILLAIEKLARRVDQLTCKVYWCNMDYYYFLISSYSNLGKKIIIIKNKDLIHCSQVDELQKEDHFSFRLSSVSLETNMILHNIQRIIQVWIRGYLYLL